MHLHVLSGGAAQGLVASLADGFKAETGVDIAGTFGAVGTMKEKLTTGTPADLVILTAPLIRELERDGHVVNGSAIDIGTVHTGIAVRAGDKMPDIDNAPALRHALRAANAIYLPDSKLATAGIHFAKVLRQLGLDTLLADRLRQYPNGAAAMHALAHDAGARPIGCTQVTEILATQGAVLAGLLPHEFELKTVYTAAVTTRAAAPQEACTLAQMLAAPQSAAARERLGFQPAT